MQKILIIDDEDLFREATACALQRKGYETHEAADGLAGAEVARRVLPDLIICDVNMGRMDGYTLLQNLRDDPVTAAIPFMLMTGMGDAEGMRRGMNLGADDYLHKPFNAQQLFSAVEARLIKQKVLRQTAEKKLAELRANISLALPHEMITPLNGIFGLAQLLSTDAESLSSAEVAEFGTSILESAERLHRTVQNFLLFGQLEIKAGDPVSIAGLRATLTLGLAAIVEERARSFAAKFSRTSDLTLEVTDGAASIARDLFTKILDELLDNACKFSKAGTPLRVSSRIEQGRYCISVTDAGPGMNPEQVAAIGAYSQFNRIRQEQQGSGLGLAISRRIAELHGGALSIVSQPGSGTTVTASLSVSSPAVAAA